MSALTAKRLPNAEEVSLPTPLEYERIGSKSTAARLFRTCNGWALKVLVVEDCISTRLIMCHYLNRLGCDVTSCSSGEEAEDLCATQKFNVIFMDVGLPGISGVQASKNILAKAGKLPLPAIVICSADPPDKGVRNEIPADCIRKPVTQHGLKQKLNQLTMQHA